MQNTIRTLQSFCVYLCMHCINLYACLCMCVYVCVRVRTQEWIHVSHVHAYMCVCTHACMCVTRARIEEHITASTYLTIRCVALKLTSSIKSKISRNISSDNFYSVISYSVLSYTGVGSEVIHCNRHDGEC